MKGLEGPMKELGLSLENKASCPIAPGDKFDTITGITDLSGKDKPLVFE